MAIPYQLKKGVFKIVAVYWRVVNLHKRVLRLKQAFQRLTTLATILNSLLKKAFPGRKGFL